MSPHQKPKSLDIIVTIFLFLAGIYGLYYSLTFPGRSGMWPTFVMIALLFFVLLHLINLFRRVLQTPSPPPPVSAELPGEGE